MSEGERMHRHGELGTFVIRVLYRRNGTWQGRITWADEKETMCFRSVLEMVKRIESALDTAEHKQQGMSGDSLRK